MSKTFEFATIARLRVLVSRYERLGLQVRGIDCAPDVWLSLVEEINALATDNPMLGQLRPGCEGPIQFYGVPTQSRSAVAKGCVWVATEFPEYKS